MVKWVIHILLIYHKVFQEVVSICVKSFSKSNTEKGGLITFNSFLTYFSLNILLHSLVRVSVCTQQDSHTHIHGERRFHSLVKTVPGCLIFLQVLQQHFHVSIPCWFFLTAKCFNGLKDQTSFHPPFWNLVEARCPSLLRYLSSRLLPRQRTFRHRSKAKDGGICCYSWSFGVSKSMWRHKSIGHAEYNSQWYLR